jgi:hypothetical protein
LDAVLREHGNKDKWDLVKETTGIPSTKRCTSRTRPPDPVRPDSETYGGEQSFRHDRPVVSEEAGHV